MRKVGRMAIDDRGESGIDRRRTAQHEDEQLLRHTMRELAERVEQLACGASHQRGQVDTGVGIAHEILETQQHDADAPCCRVASQHAARRQQLLEYLVIGRERDAALEIRCAEHERQRRLEALGRERGGNGQIDDCSGCLARHGSRFGGTRSRSGRFGVDDCRHGIGSDCMPRNAAIFAEAPGKAAASRS